MHWTAWQWEPLLPTPSATSTMSRRGCTLCTLSGPGQRRGTSLYICQAGRGESSDWYCSFSIRLMRLWSIYIIVLSLCSLQVLLQPNAGVAHPTQLPARSHTPDKNAHAHTPSVLQRRQFQGVASFPLHAAVKHVLQCVGAAMQVHLLFALLAGCVHGGPEGQGA